jgi:hypothetical protein
MFLRKELLQNNREKKGIMKKQIVIAGIIAVVIIGIIAILFIFVSSQNIGPGNGGEITIRIKDAITSKSIPGVGIAVNVYMQGATAGVYDYFCKGYTEKITNTNGEVKISDLATRMPLMFRITVKYDNRSELFEEKYVVGTGLWEDIVTLSIRG